MKEARGGYNTYGYTVGIMMLRTSFPRMPGDLGNGTTFDFPVRLKIVQEAVYHRVVGADQDLLAPFIKAAKELEAEGVTAIATNCGFLAIFQKELAAAVDVPVFTSSLLLVPLVSSMLRPDQRVGIMTVSGENLGEKQFNGCGWSSMDIPVVIAGMEGEKLFTSIFRDDLLSMNVEQMQRDMVAVAKRLVAEHRDVGAIVFECTNMAPYAHAVQAAVGLPVFDIQALIRMVYRGLHQRRYVGHQ